jgi:hypothetical protein
MVQKFRADHHAGFATSSRADAAAMRTNLNDGGKLTKMCRECSEMWQSLFLMAQKYLLTPREFGGTLIS